MDFSYENLKFNMEVGLFLRRVQLPGLDMHAVSIK